MQLTLKPQTEQAGPIIEEHGSEWLLIKVAPQVTYFNGPGAWVESIQDKFGMWLSIECSLENKDDKLSFTVNDPDYKHII
jgi:hypothetical protein